SPHGIDVPDAQDEVVDFANLDLCHLYIIALSPTGKTAMKIWYQSLFDAGRIPAYFDGVRKRLATVARPGTEVHLHAMPEGVYGTRTPAEAVVYPYIASLHAQIILENGLRAEAEGYDVFALSSVQDPALEEARRLL